MTTFVIEHIPREQEESELLQAGNITSELMSSLSMLMLVGNRIVTIHKDGRPMSADETLPIFILSAKFLAVERLGTSLGMTLDESMEKLSSLFFDESPEEFKETKEPPPS